MLHDNGSKANLREEWREFLRLDADAHAVIFSLMKRKGLTAEEALFHLIEAWLDQNLIREEQRERRIFATRKVN